MKHNNIEVAANLKWCVNLCMHWYYNTYVVGSMYSEMRALVALNYLSLLPRIHPHKKEHLLDFLAKISKVIESFLVFWPVDEMRRRNSQILKNCRGKKKCCLLYQLVSLRWQGEITNTEKPKSRYVWCINIPPYWYAWTLRGGDSNYDFINDFTSDCTFPTLAVLAWWSTSTNTFPPIPMSGCMTRWRLSANNDRSQMTARFISLHPFWHSVLIDWLCFFEL